MKPKEEIKQINFMWKLIQEMQKQEGLRRLEFMENLKINKYECK